MRHRTGSPIPDAVNPGGGRAFGPGCRVDGCGRWLASSVVQAAIAVACAVPASAQAPWWIPGWASGAGAQAASPADQLADYMFTGQTPHPAVARIVAPEASGTSLGSGVLVDLNHAQGLVLTNWHVVRDSRSAVLVQFPDGFQSTGTVVRWDQAWDLAAVVIWKPHATPVPIAESPPAIGEQLTIAGFGRGVYREQTGACTDYLSPGSGYAKEFVELKATARQGDSGGPIFNERRELAGVLFGQNDGLTIGSCSTRLRAFLAAVGSQGFTPMPLAQGSAEPAADRGVDTGANGGRVAVMPVSDVVTRSSRVADMPPAMPLGPQPIPPMPFSQVQPVPGGQPSPWAGLGLPPWVPDPFTHGATMLAGAGGIALVFLGLKLLFGGRRA